VTCTTKMALTLAIRWCGRRAASKRSPYES
jgi:hypothetical protein